MAVSNTTMHLFRVHSVTNAACLIATTFSPVSTHMDLNNNCVRCTVLAVEAMSDTDIDTTLALLDDLTKCSDVYITPHGIDAPLDILYATFWRDPGAGHIRPTKIQFHLLYVQCCAEGPGRLAELCDMLHAILSNTNSNPVASLCAHMCALRHLCLLSAYDSEICALLTGGSSSLHSLSRLRWC